MRFGRLLLLVGMVPAMLAADAYGVVREPVANMYSKASADAAVVSQAIYGTRIEIFEERGSWAKIGTPDAYTGWMESSHFRTLRDGETPYASTGRVARVDSLFANLYSEADVTKHRPVLVVPFETKLEITAEPQENGARWLRAGLVDGSLAWVQRGDITFDDAPIPMDAMVRLSKRFLGLPYLWGGTSTFGYDCSGFMQMLYRRIGVMLPRDAQPQAEWSGLVPADRKDLRPGDLLYFGPSDHKITHTGMYIGGGEFINATVREHPVVRIDKIGEPSWSKLLVAARRLK